MFRNNFNKNETQIANSSVRSYISSCEKSLWHHPEAFTFDATTSALFKCVDALKSKLNVFCRMSDDRFPYYIFAIF